MKHYILDLNEVKNRFASNYKTASTHSGYAVPVDEDLKKSLFEKFAEKAMAHIYDKRYGGKTEQQVTFDDGLNDALAVQYVGHFLHAMGLNAQMSMQDIFAAFGLSRFDNGVFADVITGKVNANFSGSVGGMNPALAMITQGLLERPIERYYKYLRQSVNWVAERVPVPKMKGSIEVVVTNSKTGRSKEGKGGVNNDFIVSEKNYQIEEYTAFFAITSQMLQERSYKSFQRMISRSAGRAISVQADAHAVGCLFFDAKKQEPAENFGIEDNDKGIQFLDFERGIDQLNDFGHSPTHAILSQETRLKNLYQGEMTAPKSFDKTFPEITPSKQITPPENLELLFDKNDAMWELTFGNTEIRRETDFESGDLKFAFVARGGNIIAQPTARIAIKSDTLFADNNFGDMGSNRFFKDIYKKYE